MRILEGQCWNHPRLYNVCPRGRTFFNSLIKIWLKDFRWVMLSIKDSTNNIFLIHKGELSPQYLKNFIRGLLSNTIIKRFVNKHSYTPRRQRRWNIFKYVARYMCCAHLWISIGDFCFSNSDDIKMKICFMQKLSLKIFQVTIKADYIVMKNRKARDTLIFWQLRFHFLKAVG